MRCDGGASVSPAGAMLVTVALATSTVMRAASERRNANRE